ncbi:MAG: diacylglycerol/lipid kinase family protein [Wujia sp.]
MKKLLFVINPKAGKTAIKNDFFDIMLAFSEAGYEVAPYFTTGSDDAERKLIADGADYDLIVCAGGDGTLENTVCGYMKMGDKKAPLGYIPVGTTNDFARSHKISRRPLEAAKQIIDGKISQIDVGKFDDKYFIYIAAFGIFTDISYTTKQSLKKVMGHSAYVLEGIKNIANVKSYKIRGEFDGALLTGSYIYGMVTNSMSVAGFKIRGTKHAILDDGKFDCLFIRTPKNPAELQSIITAMLTNEIDGNEMFFEFKASRVKIECEEAIPWTIDGEFGGDKTEVVINNEKQAIRILMSSKTDYNFDDEIAITEGEGNDDGYDSEDDIFFAENIDNVEVVHETDDDKSNEATRETDDIENINDMILKWKNNS